MKYTHTHTHTLTLTPTHTCTHLKLREKLGRVVVAEVGAREGRDEDETLDERRAHDVERRHYVALALLLQYMNAYVCVCVCVCGI